MAVLEARKVDIKYIGSEFEINDFNLTLNEGDCIPIYGRFDFGKTTLLRTLCKLEEYSGSILLDGIELKEISQKDINIGYTFDADILKRKSTVGEVLSFPMSLRKLSQDRIDSYISNVSARCGFSADDTVESLSDLQKAMLILARLFSVERKIYLIDDVWEGLSNDEKTGVWEYLKDKLYGKTALIATKDIQFAKAITNRAIVILSHNQVLTAISAEDIQRLPLNMESAIFAGYGLHVGRLSKNKDGTYCACLYGKNYLVDAPINDIYVSKEVCFAVKSENTDGDAEIEGLSESDAVKQFYYDLKNERLISSSCR